MGSQKEISLPRQFTNVNKAVSYASAGSREPGVHQRISMRDGLSPFGPPKGFDELETQIRASNEARLAQRSYYEADITPAEEGVLKRFGCDDRSRVLFNTNYGSDGLIRNLLIALRSGTRIAGVGPHWPGIVQNIDGMDELSYGPISPPLNLSADERLLWTVENHKRTPGRNKLGVIYNSSPTFRGDLPGRDVRLEAIRHFTDKGVLWIEDEDMADFYPDHESVADETQDNPYLVVARSASKAIGLPGLGFGYMILNENTARILEQTMSDHSLRGVDRLLINALFGDSREFIDPHLEEVVRPQTRDRKITLRNELTSWEIDTLPTDNQTPVMFVDGKVEGIALEASKMDLVVAPGSGFDRTYDPNLSTRYARAVILRSRSQIKTSAERLAYAIRVAQEKKTPSRDTHIPVVLFDDVAEPTD